MATLCWTTPIQQWRTKIKADTSMPPYLYYSLHNYSSGVSERDSSVQKHTCTAHCGWICWTNPCFYRNTKATNSTMLLFILSMTLMSLHRNLQICLLQSTRCEKKTCTGYPHIRISLAVQLMHVCFSKTAWPSSNFIHHKTHISIGYHDRHAIRVLGQRETKTIKVYETFTTYRSAVLN